MLPLDDRRFERFNAELAGRPQLVTGTSQVLFGRMGRLSENSLVVVKNKSHAVTAQVSVPERGAHGTIVAQGGAFGGWSLYLQDGRPTYTYNWVGLQRYTVAAREPLAAGKATITVDFAYDGGGRGKGGTATLSVNGTKVAAGRCTNWTDTTGDAVVGHSDSDTTAKSTTDRWNNAHTVSCTVKAIKDANGAGRFYCFAKD